MAAKCQTRFSKKKSGKLYLSNALVKRTKQAKNKRKIILIQLPDPDLPKLTMFEAHTPYRQIEVYSPKSPWT